jgi:hypothetical protein
LRPSDQLQHVTEVHDGALISTTPRDAALEPEANPEDCYFRVLLDDAAWESLVREALAADAFYRRRDAS